MSKITKTIKLVFTEISTNNNKWWKGELFDNGDVVTTWGRIGEGTQSKTFSSAGQAFLDKKEKEKIKKGYTLARVLGDEAGGTIISPKDANLHKLAHSQLFKQNPQNSQLAKLVDRLIATNIHNIVSQTNIIFNSSTGLFQTPLGIVTKEAIDDARDLLVEIKKSLIDKNKAKLVKLASKYLRIVPQVLNRKLLVEDIFPDSDSVKKQADILASLEASLASVVTPLDKDKDKDYSKEEKIFDVYLDILNDDKERKRIMNYYSSSMKSSHGYSHVKIREIYSSKLNKMDKDFNRKLGNCKEVYHGSGMGNILSILKSGLKCSPPSSAYIAGKMWGNGIYGAINSSKSLGYTFGKWGGKSSESGWLFVCDFAMGKVYEPASTRSSPPSGYNSIWAKAAKCGLCHDELIVYNDNNVNIKYLLEVK